MKITFPRGTDKVVGGIDCAKPKGFALTLKVRKVRRDHHDEVNFNLKNEGRVSLNQVKRGGGRLGGRTGVDCSHRYPVPQETEGSSMT